MSIDSFDKKLHDMVLLTEAEAQLARTSGRNVPSHSAEELLHDLRVHQIELEMQNEELRRAHAAIEETRDRYADLYDFSPVGYVTINREGMISEINLTGAALLGVGRAELINRRFAAFVALKDRERWYRMFLSMMEHAEGEKRAFGLEMTRADGELFCAHLDGLRRASFEGVSTLRFALTDISKSKQIDEELHIAAAAFESQEGMVVTDPRGVVMRINRAFSAITGYSDEEVVGKKMNFLKSDRHDADFYAAIWNTILTAGVWQGEIWNRNKNGETHPFRLAVSAVRDGSGIVTHYVGAYADITELKQAEQYEQFRSRALEVVASDRPLRDILEEIVLGVEKLNPAMICSILLLDKAGTHLGNGVAPSLPEFYNAAIDGFEIGMGAGFCGTAAFTGEPVIVEDIQTHPYWSPYKELAQKAGLGSCWSQPILSSSGKVLGTFAIYHRKAYKPGESDINLIKQSAHLASIAIERSIAAEKIRDSEAHYRLLTEDVSDVVWKLDRDHRFTYISPADERLRGYRADEVIGRDFTEMMTEDGVEAVKQAFQQWQNAAQNGMKPRTFTVVAQQRCKDGRTIWAEILSTPERDAQGEITGYHGISRDISERKQMEDKVRQLAFYDALTKLPNRRMLNDRLCQTIAATKRSGCHAAVMFLDLDNFKPLNDAHGHVVGDLLLVEVADRLRKCVREMDTVARFGGDEFVVMINELQADRAESIKQADMVAEKIRASLAEPYVLKVRHEGMPEITVTHNCTISIGVMVFRDYEGEQDDILMRADAAMYQAKDAGRNSIRFCDL